jgi:aminoglycoside 6'-N-acetyltransferase I
MNFTIREVTVSEHALIAQIAHVLIAAFDGMTDAYEAFEDAHEGINEIFEEDGIAFVALDESDYPLGIIGGLPSYALAWELHPLAVVPRAQRMGIGRALVQALEAAIAARGGVTVYLGSDDEANLTSLFGVDMYPDPLQKLLTLSQRPDAPIAHPFVFYQKMGYSVVGVIPDANGFGKPDILMAKRVMPSSAR